MRRLCRKHCAVRRCFCEDAWLILKWLGGQIGRFFVFLEQTLCPVPEDHRQIRGGAGMLRKLYQKHRTTVNKFDAVLLNNPVLERGLVIAPVIVAANSLKNALSLGVAFAVITFFHHRHFLFHPKEHPLHLPGHWQRHDRLADFYPWAMLVEQMLPGSTRVWGFICPSWPQILLSSRKANPGSTK